MINSDVATLPWEIQKSHFHYYSLAVSGSTPRALGDTASHMTQDFQTQSEGGFN